LDLLITLDDATERSIRPCWSRRKPLPRSFAGWAS
jgi:hypothetical protein